MGARHYLETVINGHYEAKNIAGKVYYELVLNWWVQLRTALNLLVSDVHLGTVSATVASYSCQRLQLSWTASGTP